MRFFFRAGLHKKSPAAANTAAGPFFGILFSVFNSTRLPHHIDFNLSGINHIVFYTFSYILCKQDGGVLRHLVGLDYYADFSSCLYSEAFFCRFAP